MGCTHSLTKSTTWSFKSERGDRHDEWLEWLVNSGKADYAARSEYAFAKGPVVGTVAVVQFTTPVRASNRAKWFHSFDACQPALALDVAMEALQQPVACNGAYLLPDWKEWTVPVADEVAKV